MKLRAIYLSDLAFDPKDGNLIFEYDKNINKFKMIINEDIQYFVEDVIEDDKFMVFTTNLIYDEELKQHYGEVNPIDKKDILKFIKKS